MGDPNLPEIQRRLDAIEGTMQETQRALVQLADNMTLLIRVEERVIALGESLQGTAARGLENEKKAEDRHESLDSRLRPLEAWMPINQMMARVLMGAVAVLMMAQFGLIWWHVTGMPPH
jgi:hypothetical protein